jgi:hypothetical protein
MDKKRVSNKKKLPDPSKGKAYTFYHHGNRMILTVYDKYICIKNMDEKEYWYRVDPKDTEALKKQFHVPEDEKIPGQKVTDGSGSDKDQSHEKEIEEESAQ